MSLTDTIFILIGALVLFGPKKLPELARQLGKIMGELRRASNEFKFQMEEELRQSEDADRRAAQAAPPPVAQPVGQSAGTAVMIALPPASTANGTPVIARPSTGDPVANHISIRAQQDLPVVTAAPELIAAPPSLQAQEETSPEASPHG